MNAGIGRAPKERVAIAWVGGALRAVLAAGVAVLCAGARASDGIEADGARAARTDPAAVAPVLPAGSSVWEAACPDPRAETVSLLVTPLRGLKGPMRVLVAADAALPEPLEVRFVADDGSATVAAAEPIEVLDMMTFGYRFSAPDDRPRRSLQLRAGDSLLACRDVRAARYRAPAWTPALERLYALWVSRLLHIPFGQLVDTLAPLLRDPARNLLHGALGLDEDAPGSPLALDPDCADFPLVLRAYFAWKLNLPFGLNAVPPPSWWPPHLHPAASATGGGLQRLWMIIDPTRGPLAPRGFLHHMIALMSQHSWWRMKADWGAWSSTLYPVALTREALRPGTVYLDPHSHVSIVAGWQDAGDGKARLILADAQPTKFIALHKYVEGRLVYRQDRPAGFRTFRPLSLDRQTGTWRPLAAGWLTEARVGARHHAGRAPRESEASFRERIETLQDPAPRDPGEALGRLVEAFEATVRERATIVETGFQVRRARTQPVPLPQTAREMFHGLGDWEAWSTPCRDLRLLGFMRIVQQFPEAVAANPARYRLPPGESPESVRARLEAERDRVLAARTFSYTRSDGSQHTLTLADVAARKEAFAAAYNPNDCPEHRWGAAAGSPEAATCALRAPEEQQARMVPYRDEFEAGYGCD